MDLYIFLLVKRRDLGTFHKSDLRYKKNRIADRNYSRNHVDLRRVTFQLDIRCRHLRKHSEDSSDDNRRSIEEDSFELVCLMDCYIHTCLKLVFLQIHFVFLLQVNMPNILDFHLKYNLSMCCHTTLPELLCSQ
eukprot:TRINITY_DN19722_c0_g1_i1.p2 TRINITY_DN19722_c0_g1~~TRINITY_DN19722_c0_g1_i1.p2  ORF type:complete len:134 (+),score=3.50 TRINITY_DN19722_c0_g1_i1:58-459(+)